MTYSGHMGNLRYYGIMFGRHGLTLWLGGRFPTVTFSPFFVA